MGWAQGARNLQLMALLTGACSPAGGHDVARYKLQLYAECWTKLRMWELEQWDRLG